MQEMRLHPQALFFGKFGQIWVKFGQIWVQFGQNLSLNFFFWQIWAGLGKFGQNLSLNLKFELNKFE